MMSNNTRAVIGPHHLRPASPADAPAIYALKTQAFGDSSLLYTIYQAPQSVHYLARLVSRSPKLSGQRLFVIEQDGQIRGYYHAVSRAAQYFLNYIAVAQEAEHQGLGAILLQHFEETGRTIGCDMLQLDVFDSNLSARDWYYRRGYHLTKTSFHVRLAMDALTGNSGTLSCQRHALVRALAEEEAWGFSKVEFTCGSGHLTVGLIAGHTCKLLYYNGLSVVDAVSAIADRFNSERQILVISSLPDLPLNWPILSAEKSLRLIKTIK